MSKLLCLSLLLTACELQPAPPRPAASETAPVAVAPPLTPPPATAPADAGVATDAKPLIAVTPRCVEVGVHVASVVISGAEPSQRAIFEQERERIVRGTAEVCTTQAWSEPAITCYLAASTQAKLKVCEAKFPPPTAPQAAPTPSMPEAAAPGALRRPADVPAAQPTRPVRPARPATGSGAGSANRR